MSAATQVIDWEHVNLGTVLEPLCDVHAREVLNALALLGTGYIGRPARDGEACARCESWVPGRSRRGYLEKRQARISGDPVRRDAIILDDRGGAVGTKPGVVTTKDGRRFVVGKNVTLLAALLALAEDNPSDPLAGAGFDAAVGAEP